MEAEALDILQASIAEHKYRALLEKEGSDEFDELEELEELDRRQEESRAVSTSAPKRTSTPKRNSKSPARVQKIEERKGKKGRPKLVVNKEALEKVFCLPFDKACLALGVGSTTLKRICKEEKVGRWPYRKLMSKTPAPKPKIPGGASRAPKKEKGLTRPRPKKKGNTTAPPGVSKPKIRKKAAKSSATAAATGERGPGLGTSTHPHTPNRTWEADIEAQAQDQAQDHLAPPVVAPFSSQRPVGGGRGWNTDSQAVKRTTKASANRNASAHMMRNTMRGPPSARRMMKQKSPGLMPVPEPLPRLSAGNGHHNSRFHINAEQTVLRAQHQVSVSASRKNNSNRQTGQVRSQTQQPQSQRPLQAYSKVQSKKQQQRNQTTLEGNVGLHHIDSGSQHHFDAINQHIEEAKQRYKLEPKSGQQRRKSSVGSTAGKKKVGVKKNKSFIMYMQNNVWNAEAVSIPDLNSEITPEAWHQELRKVSSTISKVKKGEEGNGNGQSKKRGNKSVDQSNSFLLQIQKDSTIAVSPMMTYDLPLDVFDNIEELLNAFVPQAVKQVQNIQKSEPPLPTINQIAQKPPMMSENSQSSMLYSVTSSHGHTLEQNNNHNHNQQRSVGGGVSMVAHSSAPNPRNVPTLKPQGQGVRGGGGVSQTTINGGGYHHHQSNHVQRPPTPSVGDASVINDPRPMAHHPMTHVFHGMSHIRQQTIDNMTTNTIVTDGEAYNNQDLNKFYE